WRSRLALPMTAVALAFGALALWSWLRPEPAPPIRRYRLGIPPGANLARSLLPAFSPDGSLLAAVGGAGGGLGLPQVYLLRRDQLDATPVPGTVGGLAPFFSPDGRRLAYTEVRTGVIRAVGLDGEPPVTLGSGVVSRRGSWGPDGFLYLTGAGGELVRLSEAGGPLEPVTRLDSSAGETSHLLPDVLPNGKGVLFTIARGDSFATTVLAPERWDIAVLDLATLRHEVLLRGLEARFAPGGHLVYVTADGVLHAVRFDAERMRVEGSPVVVAEGLVVRGGGVDLALSGAGDLLYVAGVEPPDPDQLVWVDRDGGSTPVDSAWAGVISSVALSPDGGRLAVSMGSPGEQQIWVKPVGGGPALRLTFEGGRNLRPAWSPDGGTVVFESERGGNADLYTKPADGSGPEAMLLDVNRPLQGPVWSRDGRWLVVRAGAESPSASRGERDILGIRVGGDSPPIPVVATPADEVAPTLSPDGRFLAYVSDESGRSEVYVRPFPDAGRAKWQVSVDGGTEPLWGRGGRELFYRSSSTLRVASLGAGPGFAIEGIRDLFPLDWTFPRRPAHRAYDIAPDGRRFLFIRRRPTEGLQIILVENWLGELESPARR
ncbi:MAG TPA: hypothetical protein VJ773_00005, partial [Gemmatimonadales bacterium]|nr:hypothetical protein [Gemmatimonadales bacterium]